uniref:Homeobox domain-containing protein n=1 Tax=Steinernema glaseri TaxID=37863 RepID=A0A1I8AGJ8_9BILA
MSTPKENDASATMAPSANGERRSKKPSSRPAMQIYRPPGLRSSDENQQAKPLCAAGPKQPKKDSNEPSEENNNNEKTVSAERVENSSSPLSNSSASSPNGNARGALKRNDSSLSNSSQRSQHRASPPVMSVKSSGGKSHKKEQTPLRPANQQKKKPFGAKEIEEIAAGFRQLNFAKEAANIELFLAADSPKETSRTRT